MFEIESHTIACKCLNVAFNGSVIDESKIPCGSSFLIKKGKSNKSKIIQIEKNTLCINHIDTVLSHTYSGGYIELCCASCCSSFRIIIQRERAIAVKYDDDKQSYLSMSRPLSLVFPRMLKPFYQISLDKNNLEIDLKKGKSIPVENMNSISTYQNVAIDEQKRKKKCISNPAEDTFIEDSDFELMFAGGNDCFVGSFSPQWIDDYEI
ncbi:hypothetical protein TRFO_32950 [Tritrichomonas foetus]|uniref:Uncharacterized protein n=1 Tax=Tritrichomonas foetus TaxID=1144522 RepID=A0A1J4JPS2_9EUKA|nr:hypothetical protein TRFO_32950 [Tritrichomonas foetus]|eukprot:OHT00408.1 hypothetical protein TRFO_32950 [Tritrichomonas foetus]